MDDQVSQHFVTKVKKKNQPNLCALVAVLLSTCLFCPSASAVQPFKWPTSGDKTVQQADPPSPKPASSSSPSPEQAPSANDIVSPDSTTSGSSATKAADPTDSRKPFSAEAIKHYNRGVELHQSAFLNQAIEEYKAALNADPRIEPAWSNLGGIYAAQRSYNKAMEAFEKAYELNPHRATTLNGMATVLYARGKIEEAKQKWQQAADIDPSFASAYYNIGNACEGEKKPLNAIEWYVKAFDTNPKMADAIFRVGCIYVKLKHPAQAELMLEKAIEAAPDADFVKEARRMLSQIQAEYQRDMAQQGEVRMKVVPAPDPSPPKQLNQQTAAGPNAVTKAEQSGTFAPPEKHHKKKKKDSQTESAGGDSTASTNTSDDLQQKPVE
jgi:tetratricopeptide (TPR) repeat protein